MGDAPELVLTGSVGSALPAEERSDPSTNPGVVMLVASLWDDLIVDPFRSLPFDPGSKPW